MNALIAALSAVFAASLALGGPPRFLPPWTALFLLSGAILLRGWIEARRDGLSYLESRPDAALFWLCLTLYLASFRWHGGDDIPNSMLPFQLWRHGTLAFDEVRAWATAPGMVDMVRVTRGRLLSTYPVAPGVLAAPLYAIPAAAGLVPTDTFLHNLAKISGALMTAASVVVFRRAAARLASPRWALDCALLYGLGSYAFSVSSQALYSHAPAALGVALGLLGLLSEGPEWSALAGFGFALAWTAREDSLVFAAAAAAYLLLHRRERLAAFAAGALLPVALNLAYWHHYVGAFRPPYYELQAGIFGPPGLAALAGMLFSPTRGLLFFFPAAAFGIWGALRALRRGHWWAFYFAGACAATWFAFGMRMSWTAGNTYGDRYFAVVCLVLALFAAELEEPVRAKAWIRGAWSAVFAYSVLLHGLGAAFQWPDYNATLAVQEADAWRSTMFPLLHVFVDGGPIGATPQPWRTLYGLLIMTLIAVPAWRWSRRRLSAR
ncbi:MAG TPA: hypothetical protein VN915_05835 [Elusimicrobiota bacterium]|nr:hypothetical protein [Elusimicrobiota bacterium]